MRVKSECKNKDKKKSTQSARSARSARSAQSARSAVCSLQSAWSAFWGDRVNGYFEGRGTKTEISCEWNTKFSIIPEIPLKRVHSKRIPKFSKTFTVPFSFGPEISEILVEWKASLV